MKITILGVEYTADSKRKLSQYKKLKRAIELKETTSLSLQKITNDVGYEEIKSLRTALKKIGYHKFIMREVMSKEDALKCIDKHRAGESMASISKSVGLSSTGLRGIMFRYFRYNLKDKKIYTDKPDRGQVEMSHSKPALWDRILYSMPLSYQEAPHKQVI